MRDVITKARFAKGHPGTFACAPSVNYTCKWSAQTQDAGITHDQAHTRAHARTHARTHVHVHVHTHTHTHTHTQPKKQGLKRCKERANSTAGFKNEMLRAHLLPVFLYRRLFLTD